MKLKFKRIKQKNCKVSSQKTAEVKAIKVLKITALTRCDVSI